MALRSPLASAPAATNRAPLGLGARRVGGVTGVPPAPAGPTTPTTAGVAVDCDPQRPTLGSVCAITLVFPNDERLESVAWSFSDLAGNAVRVYEIGKEPKDYDGFVRNAT